jgi:hypothetical protein
VIDTPDGKEGLFVGHQQRRRVTLVGGFRSGGDDDMAIRVLGNINERQGCNLFSGPKGGGREESSSKNWSKKKSHEWLAF